MTSPARIRRLELAVGEFIASHAPANAVVDFSAFRQDPIGFAHQVLHVPLLWEAQREHLRAAAESPRVCAYGANGTGKTRCDAMLALWWIFCRDGLVIATSAKEAQLREQFMREIRGLFHRAPALPGELYSMALRRPEHPDAGLLCQAAGSSDNLRSFHAPHVFIQIHEAQGVEPFVFESAEMMAVGADDRVTATGNSSQPGGEFHRRVKSMAWRSVHYDATEHPNVTTGTVVIPGGPTRESIAQRATDYGTDSGFYLASVKGLFPDDSAESLVHRAWLEAAVERWIAKVFEREAKYRPFVCGLDVARMGNDETALAPRQGPVLRFLATWRKMETMETVGMVSLELQRRNILPLMPQGRTTLIVDANGIGAGVYDRLMELDQYRVKEFQAGHWVAPTRGTSFLNKRAECYWGLRRLLEMGKIALPRDELLFEELTSTQWRVNSASKVQIEAKPDLKARIGRSPDRADATSQAFDGVYKPAGDRCVVGEMDH